ncbi:MAG: DUF1858 domain-containing protein [Patescibacteria group bacterium]
MRTEPAKPRKKRAEKMPSGEAKTLFSKNMPVSAIVALLPESEPVLAEYGLHCFHCPANTVETLEQGCKGHGFTDEDIDELMTDINELFQSKPRRPEELTITLDAALALKDVLQSEEGDRVLFVALDERGGFCMECLPLQKGMLLFSHRKEPSVKVAAEPLTLARIGGSTIDFREGRFKLDLPEDQTQRCACSRDSCQCIRAEDGVH